MFAKYSSSIKVLFFQGFGMVLSLATIQVLVGFLGKDMFGVWLTVVTITSWLNLLDGGISNGLRNKLTSLLTKNKGVQAKYLISSSYLYMFLVLVFFFVCFVCISYFLNWSYILNAKDEGRLFIVVIFAVSTVFVNVFFSLNSSIAYSLHKPEFKSLRYLLEQGIYFSCCMIFSRWGGSTAIEASYLIAGSYFASSLVSNIAGYYYIFSRYKHLTPVVKCADVGIFKGIGNVGINFLLLQIAAIVLFSTDSILVAHLFEPVKVSEYNVTNKLFLAVIFVQSALLAPYWALYTKAQTKNDLTEIMCLLKRSVIFTKLLFVCLIILVVFSQDIISLWFGNLELYNRPLFVALALLTAVRLWSSNFSTLMNGLGILKVQIVVSIIAMFINIPASIILVKWFGFGVEGIAYGSAVALSMFAVVGPIYSSKNKLVRFINKSRV